MVRQATPSAAEQRAHVLRRLRLAPHPAWLDRVENDDPQETVERVLTEDDRLILSDDEVATHPLAGEDVGNQDLVMWWFDRLRSPDAGLHERMVWFWHGHLTSSLDGTSTHAMWRQHHLLRKHALGNFRDLLHAMTTDAAMLQYLDGDGSRGDAPNENYARESMELFALGPDTYTEDDVRVAARGFSGWRVDYESGEVRFEPDEHYGRPLRFFGERRRWTAAALIDKMCDQPACATHVVSRLHAALVGGPLSDQRRQVLAENFRANDLEIEPLVADLARDAAFVQAIHTRPRTGVEWMVAVGAALGATAEIEPWWLDRLGQVPFYPPNVAGWPDDERWLGAGPALARTNILLNIELPAGIVNAVEATVDQVANHCGIFDLSDASRAALDAAAERQPEYDAGLEMLLALTMNTPEFLLA